MRKRTTQALLGIVLLWAVTAVAQGPPMLLSHQGRLTSSGGTPVPDGTYTMTFSLYDSPIAGTPLWSSSARQVTVTDGLYTYVLGDTVALDYSLFNRDSGLWLGTQVGVDPELTPRILLTGSPTAAVSSSVRGDVTTSLGQLTVGDGRTGQGFDSTVVVDSRASTFDHRGHVTILKISNGGTDTTDLVGIYGDGDFPNVTLGDDTDLDSGVVVQSAVDHKHRGHVTILKISNGGSDTTDLVGMYGDSDFPNITVGDDTDLDSGVVVQSAVDHKHRGHVTILKISNGGFDTTDLVGMYGDSDFPNITVGDDTDLDSGVVVQSAVDHKHRGHVTILKISNGGSDTTGMVGMYGDSDSPRLEVGDSDDPDSGMVVQAAVDHKHRGHVTILKISNGGNDTTNVAEMSGSGDSASFVLQGGSGSGGSIMLAADGSTSSGRIGVNTLTPAYELDVVGTMCASNGVCQQSDRRLKKDIEALSDALSAILVLTPVRYNWRNEQYPERQFSRERQLGFIAQEVQDIVPEIVTQGSDGMLAIDYARLTPLLVQAVKEQQTEIESLTQRLAKLERAMTTLVEGNSAGDRQLSSK